MLLFYAQEFAANEQRAMPLQFIVDPDLPEYVDTITLSYTFLNRHVAAINNDDNCTRRRSLLRAARQPLAHCWLSRPAVPDGGSIELAERRRRRLLGHADGLAIIVFMMIGWFGTVISESEGGLYNAQVDKSFRMGMFWFIFSEVMFFAAFFGALFYARNMSIPWLGGESNNFFTNLLSVGGLRERLADQRARRGRR